MFSFSKLIKNSAKEIFTVLSGFAKGISWQTERCKLPTAQTFCHYIKASVFLPEMQAQHPPSAFLWYLESHNLGKNSRGRNTAC